MSYTLSEFNFPSSDGKSTVHARIYAPTGATVRGVVQLSHGMIDHVQRYETLANYLTSRGFVFAGNDHLGHGMTAASEEDLGFFADREGVNCVLRDLHHMNRMLRERFPGIKPVLMGHSMGSFLSRLYAVKYPNSIQGHIIHGTGGPMGAILPMGKALVNTIMLFRGKKYRSNLVAKISFAGYNSKFPKSEGKNAWLTRDIPLVAGKDKDPKTGFIFTLSAYRDLFEMVGLSNSNKWFSEYPKDLSTLIMSGNMDPVGDYGKGPAYVYKHLLISGASDVAIRIYDGARHELFNETCRDTVFADMVRWLEGVFK